MDSPASATAKKTVNRVKDSLKRRSDSPVKKDQSAVPFADAIRAYWERDMLTFSIPAPNGGRGPAPEYTKWAGEQLARADLPVTNGMDTRNTLYQVQQTAQELFADAVGAQQVLFSTGGSSLSARVAVSSAKLLRRRIREELPELEVVAPETLEQRPGVTGVDPTHVLIETAPLGLTGYAALDWLRTNHRIDVELVDHRRILALVSFAHGEVEVDRLVTALHELVETHRGHRDQTLRLPPRCAIRGEQAMLPRDAFFATTENVRFTQAVGRVSAELVTPYPPGIPAVAPGEVYTQEAVDYLQAFVEAGGFVEGASDPTLQKLRVVAA